MKKNVIATVHRDNNCPAQVYSAHRDKKKWSLSMLRLLMSTACEGTAVQNHPDQAGIWTLSQACTVKNW